MTNNVKIIELDVDKKMVHSKAIKVNEDYFALLVKVWGPKEGPYEFKPAPASSTNGLFSPLNFTPSQSLEKRIEGSFVLEE